MEFFPNGFRQFFRKTIGGEQYLAYRGARAISAEFASALSAISIRVGIL